MRHIFIAFILSFISAPVWAGDPAAENLFGRDPGNSAAYACFSTTFDDAWLKDHPGQNVAGMTVFVARRPGEDTVWHSGNIELHFKDSKATYHVAADCSGEGMVLGCGIDCDGGGVDVTRVTGAQAVAVEFGRKIGLTMKKGCGGEGGRLRVYANARGQSLRLAAAPADACAHLKIAP
jgi:hypothetical protein